MISLIKKYFPNLSKIQEEQYAQLDQLYREWNAKINVISRKDMDNLYERHVLHSLAIACNIHFRPGTEVLDFGTGGGFPGIPLTIMIDGTGKKIRVVNEVAQALELKNVTAVHQRGEEEKGKFDFVVSRAVMPLPDLVKIVKRNIRKTSANALPNGVLCLKGGNLEDELKPFSNIVEVTSLDTFFEEDWFKEDKKLIYLPI